ncbi:hypothetical protein AGDE_05611 [Angomonas deanei]|uniref:STIMATE family, putative n=1 Tax=Angomonas deanei TaxID=59799 RepID=A0A7G2CUU8_9TRYP|nr:hypothetical protein AGDE_05611 [Angomonas deanei]CAD2222724.1 STIMATE family, putative [Angomonas deanei]|eukprot:EPY38318.1 hypothetical protein AGDE_05611 [Angomonas deanei]
MTRLSCMVFSGTGGFIMMCILAAITVVAFVLFYVYGRFVTYTEKRHPKVFLFDLSKILIASTVAAVVNYTFTAKVANAAGHVRIRGKPLEGVGWYISTCTVDVVVGAPLAILFGRLLNQTCLILKRKCHRSEVLQETLDQNCTYGKYGPNHEASKSYIVSSPPVRWTWWYSQTVTWSLCCVLSGFLSGLIVLYSFIFLRLEFNPVAWIAVVITYWNVSCLTKQWVVVSAGRIILTLLSMSIVDFFNKFKI